MPEFNEEIIIEGCLKNDRVAQKALYDQYKTKMYTLAYRITNNFDDANDVLQDGFIEVFTNLGAFRGHSKLGTWLHTNRLQTLFKKFSEGFAHYTVPVKYDRWSPTSNRASSRPGSSKYTATPYPDWIQQA